MLQPFEEKLELADSVEFWRVAGEEVLNEESRCYKTTIDQIIVKLLSNMIGRVEKERIQELCAVVLMWRESMNEEWRKYESKGEYGCYSREGDGQYILRGVNDLVLNYFPKLEGEYLGRVGRVEVLRGQAKETNLCNMIVVVAKWLYAERYTKDKLRFNDKAE